MIILPYYQTNLGKRNIFFFSTGNFEVNSEEGFNESNVQFKYHYLHHHLNSKYPQKLYDEFFFPIGLKDDGTRQEEFMGLNKVFLPLTHA